MKFIRTHRQDFGVEPLCAVIGLQVSTYYDRLTRAPSARSVANEVLAERIEKIWVDSGQTYGAPRVHAQLARDGIYVGRKRIERIMADRGWRGAYLRRGWQITTRRGPVETTETVPDLVQRDFTATRPNALWVADISYVRTLQGFFYLAMVLDVFSRRLLGWMMGDSLATNLVLDALEMAIHRRDTAPTVVGQADPELIHHSDRGTQPGFKESTQHRSSRAIVDARSGLRQASSSRGFCAACC